MTDNLLPLLELHQQSEEHLQRFLELRAKERETVRQMLAKTTEPEPALFFDDELRTIRWMTGIVKLSQNQYRFIKLLWSNKNRTADIDDIETAVWQHVNTPNRPFINKHSILMLIDRSRKAVRNAGFPYEIESIKNFSTRELTAFRLVVAMSHKNSLPEK
jgi:DNA-binding response OmpR family regulator